MIYHKSCDLEESLMQVFLLSYIDETRFCGTCERRLHFK